MKETNKTIKIPFNKPFLAGNEIDFIQEAARQNRIAGDGMFTRRCQTWIEDKTGSAKVLLTHSCTAGLEMTALLAGIEVGDEVIMPSYTFVSTANAFVLRGAVPVFVDVRSDTLNLDETQVESAISDRTKAIVCVHYAGVSCEMGRLRNIALSHGLILIEDAAQGVGSSYKGRSLGSIGDFGVYSFHETKNIISGEGGALLVNDTRFASRAEVIREKGTDRTRFFRGEVDKYTWQDIGSSFLPGELVAAFLWGQLIKAEWITERRLDIWHKYDVRLAKLEERGLVRRPVVPSECTHNGHMYYVLLAPQFNRDRVIRKMWDVGVHAVFHYVPLHLSPAGLRYGRVSGEMKNTLNCAGRVLRLPLWIGMSEGEVDYVVCSLVG